MPGQKPFPCLFISTLDRGNTTVGYRFSIPSHESSPSLFKNSDNDVIQEMQFRQLKKGLGFYLLGFGNINENQIKQKNRSHCLCGGLKQCGNQWSHFTALLTSIWYTFVTFLSISLSRLVLLYFYVVSDLTSRKLQSKPCKMFAATLQPPWPSRPKFFYGCNNKLFNAFQIY